MMPDASCRWLASHLQNAAIFGPGSVADMLRCSSVTAAQAVTATAASSRPVVAPHGAAARAAARSAVD